MPSHAPRSHIRTPELGVIYDYIMQLYQRTNEILLEKPY